MLVSAGADGTLALSDARASWGLVRQIKLSNFPYSLAAAGGLALAGLGDGSIWVIQCSTGEVGRGWSTKWRLPCAMQRGIEKGFRGWLVNAV
jgi:hypothetical protein